MKTFRISILMSLALAAGTQAWAQSPSAAPAPTAQASPAPASLSKRERIELCKKKRGIPLDPADPRPLFIDGKDGTISKPTLLQGKPLTNVYGVTGRGVVEVIIDEDGCVRHTRILKNLNAEMVKGLEQWVFQPAMKDGHPVRIYYYLTVNSEAR
ncbi:MAG: energy transducer TonB [Thermoanaerobaculia bacterium]